MYRGQMLLVLLLLSQGKQASTSGLQEPMRPCCGCQPRYCDGHLSSCLFPEALTCHHHAKHGDGSLLTAGF